MTRLISPLFAYTPIERTKDCPYRTTIHSDQGWGYHMKVFGKKLKDNKIFQSMSRRGNCLDNSPIENFFGLMKHEMYYGETYRSFEDLNKAVKEYIYYYNHKRIKTKLTGMSPVEYRQHTSQLVAYVFSLTFDAQQTELFQMGFFL